MHIQSTMTTSNDPIPLPIIPSTKAREDLFEKFKKKISVNAALDRSLVSYQANKKTPFYNWFRYKEGFSEVLVTYLLQQFTPGLLLDPFAGTGTALFAASVVGWQTQGIEVLPVGIYAMKAHDLARRTDPQAVRQAMLTALQADFTNYYNPTYALKHIAITKGAFPPQEEKQLVGFITYCHEVLLDEDIRQLFLFSVFCILEEISYTRKDGQYLRWDARSGRSQGAIPFDKGYILPFREALENKLKQIVFDLEKPYTQQALFEDTYTTQTSYARPEIREGSCLYTLPSIADKSVDLILTSPPYANRYDYTRTYALELVYLGYSDEQVKRLRQEMLSCTVENKEKRSQLENFYKSLGRTNDFDKINAVFEQQQAHREVLDLLHTYQREKRLNNPGIVSLVHNYFFEMSFVIYEMARVLRPGGTIIMVNDNVRYAGEEIPVDLILSNIAEAFGLNVKHIWTLSRGKGNSSQQMGSHGRSELRKCVYVWEKEA